MGVWERGVEGRLSELESDFDKLAKNHNHKPILDRIADLESKMKLEIVSRDFSNKYRGELEERIKNLEEDLAGIYSVGSHYEERLQKLEANDENKRWRISNLECPSPMMVKHEEDRLDHEERIKKLEKQVGALLVRDDRDGERIKKISHRLAVLENPPKTVTMKCGDRIVNTWTEPSQCSSCKFFIWSNDAGTHGEYGCWRYREGKGWRKRSADQLFCPKGETL